VCRALSDWRAPWTVSWMRPACCKRTDALRRTVFVSRMLCALGVAHGNFPANGIRAARIIATAGHRGREFS